MKTKERQNGFTHSNQSLQETGKPNQLLPEDLLERTRQPEKMRQKGLHDLLKIMILEIVTESKQNKSASEVWNPTRSGRFDPIPDKSFEDRTVLSKFSLQIECRIKKNLKADRPPVEDLKE